MNAFAILVSLVFFAPIAFTVALNMTELRTAA